MSAIAKLIRWYDGLGPMKQAQMDYEQDASDIIIEKARELMAEEEKEKPTAPAGLVEELAKYFKDNALSGKWYWGLWKPKDKEEALKWYSETLDKGSGFEQHIVMCGTGEDERIICVTGNGPHSEAHAKLITQLPEILSHYPEQATAPNGLIEELKEYCKPDPLSPTDRLNCTEDEKGYFDGVEKTKEVIMETLYHYKPEPSLAELADDKKLRYSTSRRGQMAVLAFEPCGILIHTDKGNLVEEFWGKTYAIAESKAKEYLRGLGK